MKFHLIAIILIVGIISVVSELTKPEPLAPKIVTVVQYSPTILEATWGMNCNAIIERDLAQQPQRYAARPAVPDPDAPVEDVMRMVTYNNVLEKVQALCADKEICSFKADAQTLGNVHSKCSPVLKLQHYCRENERVRNHTYRSGQPIKIDCSRKHR